MKFLLVRDASCVFGRPEFGSHFSKCCLCLNLLPNPNLFRPAYFSAVSIATQPLLAAHPWETWSFRMHIKLLTDAGPAIRHITLPWVWLEHVVLTGWLFSNPANLTIPSKLLDWELGIFILPRPKSWVYFRSTFAATCIDYSCAFLSFALNYLCIFIVRQTVSLVKSFAYY